MDAYVLIRTEPGRTREVAERAAGLSGSGIRQSVVVTGEWDVVVAIEADDPHQLGEIVLEQLLNDETVAESETCVVLSADVAGKALIPLPLPVHSRETMVALVFAKLDASLGRESPQGWFRWLGGLGEALGDVPGLQGAALISGEYDLVVEVGASDWSGVSLGILGVAALPGVGSTSTAVAVTSKLVESA